MTRRPTPSQPHEAGSSPSLTSKTLSGLLWTLSGSGFQAVINVAVMAIMARLLTPEDYGLVGAAMIVVTFSTIYSQLGVGPALVQRPVLGPHHVRTALSITLSLGVVSMALVYLLAPALAAFFKNDELTRVLRAFSPIFLLASISVIPESLLARDLKFRQLASVKLASYALGYGACGLAFAFLGAGYWALVAATFGQAFFLLLFASALQPFPKLPGFDRDSFHEVFRFASAVTFARTANYVAEQGDNVVVGRWLGVEALGLYGRAYLLMATPARLFSQAANKVIFPTLARVQDDPRRLASAFRRGMGLTALLVLPISVVVIPLGPEIVHVLLGDQWTAAIIPFQILAVGMFFRTSYQLGGSLMRAKGAVYALARFQVIYATLVVGGSLAAVPWGLAGVSSATLLALTVHFTLTTHHGLHLSEQKWRDLLPAFLPAVRLSLLFGVLTWGLVWALRARHWTSPAILLSTLAVDAAFFLLLARLAPGPTIGRDGQWLVRSVIETLAGKRRARDATNG
jgi:PST family polysaccharide transporter